MRRSVLYTSDEDEAADAVDEYNLLCALNLWLADELPGVLPFTVSSTGDFEPGSSPTDWIARLELLTALDGEGDGFNVATYQKARQWLTQGLNA